MRHRIFLFVTASSFAAGIAMQACSGPDTTADSGADATSSDGSADVAADTKPGDGSTNQCPTYTGSNALCQAAVARCQACGFSGSTCDKANFTQDCEALAAFYSPQCQNAFISTATSCDASASCSFSSVFDASLTDGQAKAADDYCAKCGDGGGCVTNVVSTVGLELFSDAICGLIDTACTPDASTSAACSITKYQLCAFNVAGANAPKNPCADAGAD